MQPNTSENIKKETEQIKKHFHRVMANLFINGADSYYHLSREKEIAKLAFTIGWIARRKEGPQEWETETTIRVD